MKRATTEKKSVKKKKEGSDSIPVVVEKRPESLSEQLYRRGAGLTRWANAETESMEDGTNPLTKLTEEERAKLFTWLRECPYDETVLHVLKDQGIENVTSDHLREFFQFEAEQHWEKRIERAAIEANALVQLVERSPVQFSAGILAALGQEAFRQISSGEVEPESMGKIATLFLRARSDERAEQMQDLKREKIRREMESGILQALEKLAEEVDKHPMARAAFEALRRELESGEGDI